MSSSNLSDTESRSNSDKQPVKYRIYSLEQAFRHLTLLRTDEQQKLYIATDEVLFNVWDALCLSIEQDYREEYLPFLPHVYDLLLSTEDGNDLYDYLVFVENTQFSSIKSDNLTKSRASRVVEILLKLRKEFLSVDSKKI